MDIYKCPKSIFENTLGNRKLPVLYILTIFLLKEPPFHEVMKGCAKGSLVWFYYYTIFHLKHRL